MNANNNNSTTTHQDVFGFGTTGGFDQYPASGGGRSVAEQALVAHTHHDRDVSVSPATVFSHPIIHGHVNQQAGPAVFAGQSPPLHPQQLHPFAPVYSTNVNFVGNVSFQSPAPPPVPTQQPFMVGQPHNHHRAATPPPLYREYVPLMVKVDVLQKNAPLKELINRQDCLAYAANQQGQPQPGGQSAKKDLFIFHIPPSWAEDDLFALFSKIGPLCRASIMRNDDDGSSKGYGFVTFKKMSDAVVAVHTLNRYVTVGERKRLLYFYIILYSLCPNHLSFFPPLYIYRSRVNA